MIDRPGCYAISAAEYHADPVATPSLSSSVARMLLAQSPYHAWYAHPRLNPAHVLQYADRFDLGTAAHAYILQGASPFAVVEADSWQTKAAREQRDVARAAGKVAILVEQWCRVQAMARAVRARLLVHGASPRPLADPGEAEQCLVWQDTGGVWCRALLDWRHIGADVIDDLKTVGGSAEPDAFIRGALYRERYDLQAAFYARGYRAVFGREPAFRFVAVEQEAPHAVSVVGLAPLAMDVADRAVARAIEQWRRCVASDIWPAYPRAVCYAEAPPWVVAEEEARQYAARAQDDGRPLVDQLMGDR
jgi:hypothetical protein